MRVSANPSAKAYTVNMDRLLLDVGRRPQLFRMFDPPARRHFGPKFPYALIYLDQPERIWIVAVSHFKQRPGYWKERLK